MQRRKEECIMNKDFIFSFIIHVNNAEKYLKETIESVVNQTIGFESNIQLILVNDGSTDHSGDICEEYHNRYPDNVIYLNQTNQGVSVARKNGLMHATGQIINCIEPADLWIPEACNIAYEFLRENDVNLVAGRICFFGQSDFSSYPLDFKFDITRVVEILEEPKCLQLHFASCFFRREVLEGIDFGAELELRGDILVMTELLIREKKYGVCRELEYHCRKRTDDASATDNVETNKSWDWDTNSMNSVYRDIVNCSKGHYGEIIPYCQWLLLNDIQWKFKKLKDNAISEQEYSRYLNCLREFFWEIDDDIINKNKELSPLYRFAMLRFKYGKNVALDAKCNNKGQLLLDNGKLAYELRRRSNVAIHILEIEDDTLILEGTCQFYSLNAGYDLIAKDRSGKVYEPELYIDSPRMTYAVDGSVVFDGTCFRFQLPIKVGEAYELVVRKKGEDLHIHAPVFKTMGKLTTGNKFSYYVNGEYIIQFVSKQFKVYGNSRINRVKKEVRYAQSLFKDCKNRFHLMKILWMRMRAIVMKTRNAVTGREIRIFSDRTIVAGDNGEALFRYVCNMEPSGKNRNYFLIDKNSTDYKRIKKLGSVLNPGSSKYKILFLASDKIISAHADQWVIDAFLDDMKYVKDLYTFQYVFLQHGIIQDDLSSWLRRFNKNIKLFVTTCPREYESIIDGNYHYGKDRVKMLGLPRYDRLIDQHQKKIAIMPTWRKNLASNAIPGTSIRPYSTEFKDSSYCKFYNRLINDSRIIHTMNEKGYVGEFYIHPAFTYQMSDFKGNDTIVVSDTLADYNRVLRESGLLITDYSSTAFDFAYMEKPIIYTQFDRDTILQDHIFSEGYFSYEDDGFGPVCLDYESAVESIVEYIRNDCSMEIQYADRVEEFFYYNDRNNCKRVLEAINAL